MSDCMQFPDTWEEFEQAYGFEDKKEIYTNGSRLIQSFRVKQWLDHIAEPERKTGEWIDGMPYVNSHWKVCSECHVSAPDSCGGYNFCPSCGADMRGEDE